PTATGKTATAIALASSLNGEIVNADSMQVYRGMDIGTAKPTPDEQRAVPFHLLDVVSPDYPFSVAEWKVRAEHAIADIAARGRRPIICGGTGMYIRALLYDWSLAETPADATVRRQLEMQARQEGTRLLYARLQEVDPVTAQRLHPNDAVRIIRALEVFMVTGKPLSFYRERDTRTWPSRQAVHIGLTMPRALLYRRIEERADRMIQSGWVAEVQHLLDQGYTPDLAPMQSLGYKEIVQHLQGAMDLDTAIACIKQNTRRFAKRQMTWFRADPHITWFDVTDLAPQSIVERLCAFIHSSGCPSAGRTTGSPAG
ncbi:MAG: tRNA (adenosine(37)-N6)-dimethylallyltransferase MiaA, partial [Chthonomonadaceae bacterium]|nr:tRNA (adenosine(37)-N6)-dimethylallyltransferase MiaA [Chthonomonadaceae bacterium]